MGGDGSGLGLEEPVWEDLECATSGGWAVVGTGPGAGDRAGTKVGRERRRE